MSVQINTYMDLYALLKKEHYLGCLHMVQDNLLNIIRRKKRIRLGIQISFLSIWPGDNLVINFMQDDRFDVDVILVWQRNTDREKEFSMLVNHFHQSGIPYVIADGTVHPSDYDILFFTSPYTFNLDNFGERDITLDTLICYIPYGIYVANIQHMQYNMLMHNICWRNYALTKADFIMGEKYCDIGSNAMVYAGYSKLDELLDSDCKNKCTWKIMGNPEKVKKIIYAPHHSINELPYQSTFPSNFQFMLDYARTHKDTTSWVFKPHPLLQMSAVRNGVFSSVEEFQDYCRQWENLPNGHYVEGEYMSWFASSDCMIFDSMSFIAEYLYVDKPSLFLTREKLNLNEFGEILMEAHYQVNGRDYAGIDNFICNQMELDEKKFIRRQIFHQVLDYYQVNRMNAADFIYKDICTAIWG